MENKEYTMPENVTIDRDFLMKILNQIKSLSDRIDVIEKRIAIPSPAVVSTQPVTFSQSVSEDVGIFFDKDRCNFNLNVKFPDHTPLSIQQEKLQIVLSNIKTIIESYGIKNIEVKYESKN